MAHPTAPSPAAVEQRIPMSYEEYLAWYGEGSRGEWVDGEVIVFMPPTALHADVVGFLYVLLSSFIRFNQLGRVFADSVEMRLRGGRSSRIPDLVFVRREHLDRLTPERLIGAADLVVEVVSADSVKRDRIEKRNEYAAAGVPEYWVFDPRPGHHTAEFLQLSSDGRYEAVALDAEGRYHSLVLPGFWLRPEWLWQDPLPFPIDCLREIAPQVLHPRRSGPAVHGED